MTKPKDDSKESVLPGIKKENQFNIIIPSTSSKEKLPAINSMLSTEFKVSELKTTLRSSSLATSDSQ